MKHVESIIAELGSEVLRVMYTKQVGVAVATYCVLTQRDQFDLFEPVRKAVIQCIEDHEEIRNTIVGQLRTDRKYFGLTSAQMTAKIYAEKEAKEDEGLFPEPPSEENGQFLLLAG